MQKSFWVFAWSAWIVMTAVGCASDEGQRSNATQDDASAAALPISWAEVYDRVIVPNGCVKCHGKAAELDLSLDNGRADLLAVAAKGMKCAPTGMLRVDPSHPETSLLLDKLMDMPLCGTRMPVGQQAVAVSSEQLELVRAWIAQGAKE
jgi:mono/diheme cytochrome c family protein